MWQRSNVEASPCALETERAVCEEQVLGDEGGAGEKEQANEREQATFYKSLQDLLNVSEGRMSFSRRTGHLRRSLPQRVFIHKRDTGCLRRPGRLAVEASH